MSASTAKLRELLAAEADVSLAILFGSLARGDAGRDSDLDIAVSTGRPMTATRCQELADRLAVLAGRPIDLVDLSTVGGALLGRILRRGTVVAQRDPGALGRLYERFLDWQADFAPAVESLLESRHQRLLSPGHG